NGISKQFTWDNTDLRAVTTANIGGSDAVLGLTVNNSPTVQDVWNTTPAWGFPYTSSSYSPVPATAPILAGALAQKAVGVSAYAWIADKFYIEGGGYFNPGSNTIGDLGQDPTAPGSIHGVAPYGRIAYQLTSNEKTFEVGAFGFSAHINPGLDQTTGYTDRYTDYGVDASYQLARENGDTLSLNARYTHEDQNFLASAALGNAAQPNNYLDDVRADASYYWRDKIGATVGAFTTKGSTDAVLYGANRTLRPDSTGITMQLDGTLFGGKPIGNRLNVRVGIQYMLYTSFDGAYTNYDGSGSKASDNNTIRAFTWVAF
ncbi:MAG: hypothetical protein KGJ05_08210, partial [Alphaproteobacteria bacterium]|nr:hypothetical protein [Alphaproteobacteria bacterium]